jgi:hypothetical protein
MDRLLNGLAVLIVYSLYFQPYVLARLGEAWRFRRTFERAQALMKAQDNWCLKAQAAASTGKLSLLEGQDFPSELELDVIVGTTPLCDDGLQLRGAPRRCERYVPRRLHLTLYK